MATLLAALSPVGTARAEAPADGWVVWASNRTGGRTEIYRARADGSEVVKLTDTGGTFPSWSPDGRWIEYHDETGDVFLMHPDGSGRKKLPVSNPGGVSAFWLHDGSGLAFTEPSSSVYLYDPDTLGKKLLFKLTDFPNRGPLFHFYAMTHDNRYLFVASDLFMEGFAVANGTFKAGYSAILVDLLDKKKMYMVGAGCWPFTPPDGDIVYHISGANPTWPDIYRMNLADLDTRSSYEPEVAHPDADWGHEYHPRISNDNKWLVYMTSNGCHWDYSCNNEIFLHRLGTKPTDRVRVTRDESFDGFPAMYVGPLWTKSSEPRLLAAPNRVTFFAREQVVPGPQTVTLKNAAGGTFDTARTTVDPAATWLDVKAQGAANVTVSLRKDGVWRGRHKATVTLSVDGAGAPVIVPVTLDADESFPATPPATPAPGAPLRPGAVGSNGCSVTQARGAGAGVAWAAPFLLLAALGRRRSRAR